MDHVCSLSSTQDEVFHNGGLQGLIDAVVEGYNSTVFAYGQTGSGKTFTMEGYDYSKASGRGPHADFDTSPEKLGLTPRSVHALFAAVEAHNANLREGQSLLRVMCHFVQIYKEAVLDLLSPSSSQTNSRNGAVTGLKIRWCAEREFYVDNLFVEEVVSAEHALELFQRGVGNKRVAETRMNAASSRSHCIFTLVVQQMDPARPEHVQASSCIGSPLAAARSRSKRASSWARLGAPGRGKAYAGRSSWVRETAGEHAPLAEFVSRVTG